MSQNPNTPENDDPEMPIVEHLIELRTRLLRIIYALGGVFILLLPFRNRVYETFALPVLNNMLPGQTMLAYDGIDIFRGCTATKNGWCAPSSSPPPCSFTPAYSLPTSSSCRYSLASSLASNSKASNTNRTSPNT